VYCFTKMKSEAPLPRPLIIDSSNRDIRVKVAQVARPLLPAVALKLCTCEHNVFASRTCVVSRTSSELFAADREAFGSAYPDKEGHNTPTGNKILGRGSVQLKLRPYRFKRCTNCNGGVRLIIRRSCRGTPHHVLQLERPL
jgi:hypothetical protein